MKPFLRKLLTGPAGGTNVWQYSETLSSNRYAANNTAAKVAESINCKGITLTRITSSNFYASLRSQVQGLGLAPFVTGRRYLVSFFIQSRSAADQFFWMRTLALSNSPGHGAKLMSPNEVRRVWAVVQATSTSLVSVITTPTTELGGEAGSDTYWMVQNTTEGGTIDAYVGGFQIEPLANSAYDDGIAIIGDSTMQGSAGTVDSVATTAREVSVWLGALLNVNVFNRGVSGNKTADMDARWATDITPIALNCKYAMIQGGVNDFGTGVALATVQANVASMVAKAIADGLLPVMLTCTPSTTIAASAPDEANRIAFNAWLIATYPRVVDIATALANPENVATLNPSWVGDGVHYSQAGKVVAARLIAQARFWDFVTPSRYRRVIGLP